MDTNGDEKIFLTKQPLDWHLMEQLKLPMGHQQMLVLQLVVLDTNWDGTFKKGSSSNRMPLRV